MSGTQSSRSSQPVGLLLLDHLAATDDRDVLQVPQDIAGSVLGPADGTFMSALTTVECCSDDQIKNLFLSSHAKPIVQPLFPLDIGPYLRCRQSIRLAAELFEQRQLVGVMPVLLAIGRDKAALPRSGG